MNPGYFVTIILIFILVMLPVGGTYALVAFLRDRRARDDPGDRTLIWSEDKVAWQGSWGMWHTIDIRRAGVFSLEEAKSADARARNSWSDPTSRPPSLLVRLVDLPQNIQDDIAEKDES